MFEYRFALILSLLTIGLIVFGGIVHNTESGLACPDWPLCYGEILPDRGEGVAIEMGHRMAAASVGFLTVLFYLTASIRKRFDGRYRRIALLSVLFVIIQGAFGALTVILRLPSFASTAHLAVSILYLSLLLMLTFRAKLSLEERSGPIPGEEVGKAVRWLGLLVCLLYLQLLLGAFVRHTGSGASAGLGPESALFGIDLTKGSFSYWPAELPGRFNMLHRYFALFLGLFTIWTGWRLRDVGRQISDPNLGRIAIATITLVITQIVLGIWSVWSFLGITAVTLHLAGGTLLFSVLFGGYLYVRYLEKPYDFRCTARSGEGYRSRPESTIETSGNEQVAT